MQFSESVKTCFKKYVVFRGRASRSEFWWFTLFTSIASLALSFIETVVFSDTLGNIEPFGAVFSLATILPTIAVGARRLHDVNRSGWWQLFPIVPGILMGVFMVSGQLGGESNGLWFIGAVVAGLCVAVVFILIIVWFAKVGTKGINRYGEDPLGDYLAVFD
ncbi:MAG: DUF805 domain-containing protein [Robiginitomaculum sp.]|nr:MAG: DUF805 domain-containing protein [Robiginitomaculum sp.]